MYNQEIKIFLGCSEGAVLDLLCRSVDSIIDIDLGLLVVCVD